MPTCESLCAYEEGKGIYVIRSDIFQHIVPHLHVVEILGIRTIYSIIPD